MTDLLNQQFAVVKDGAGNIIGMKLVPILPAKDAGRGDA